MRVDAFCFYHLCAGIASEDGCEVGELNERTENCELEPAIITRPDGNVTADQ